MGEFSKKVGEIGEDIVGQFFKRIGWGDARGKFDIACTKAQLHQSKGADGGRKSHGIDYLFPYQSPLANRTLYNLVISVKFSSDPYPANPTAKFKEHFQDLATTIECFRKSSVRAETCKKFSGIDHVPDVGVLFWINNDTGGYDDLISKIASSSPDPEATYGTIYVVDNKRISFIHDTIDAVESRFPTSRRAFFYQNTGLNFSPFDRETASDILPVESINSSILVLTATQNDGRTTFIISTIDPMSVDAVRRLMGLAQDLSSNLQADTLLLFPDYTPLDHDNDVNEAKSGFTNKQFTSRIAVGNYRATFRNLTK